MSQWDTTPEPVVPRRPLLSDARFTIAIGIVLGLTVAFGGFWEFVIVAAFGAAGFIVARIADGSIDVSGLIGRSGARR